jgi:hypothetical protein
LQAAYALYITDTLGDGAAETMEREIGVSADMIHGLLQHSLVPGFERLVELDVGALFRVVIGLGVVGFLLVELSSSYIPSSS